MSLLDTASLDPILDYWPEILESRAAMGNLWIWGLQFIFDICNKVQDSHMHSVFGHAVYNGMSGKENSPKVSTQLTWPMYYIAHFFAADLVASMEHEHLLWLYSQDKKDLATHDKQFVACPSYKLCMSGEIQMY